MNARETVIDRVTRIADETAEREQYAADVMQRMIREGAGYFMQFLMKRRMPPPDFLERLAGQLMSIAYAYEEERQSKIGYIK